MLNSDPLMRIRPPEGWLAYLFGNLIDAFRLPNGSIGVADEQGYNLADTMEATLGVVEAPRLATTVCECGELH